MNETSLSRLCGFVPERSCDIGSSVEEVEPDEIDLQMIQEIKADPDCRIFE